MDDAARSVAVRVTGRVQGVSFRAWTKERAEVFGLNGWVRNETDGSVSACLSGPPDAVERMLGEMRRGPSPAKVDTLDVRDADAPAAGFAVQR
ncbi:acylphosphatase [Roseicyclus sp. F158]|uniref:Acylphosphatase n=1 Tax=Tropicimonas omnivorans TaxID=3075590 RepID=A0ABU3DGG2_9RHOB|nr:acylphosphatase [Roseicyclus sp. F158]MDT0682242.1 acylphosphatase [Roseicyclus sp. F158]